jgi:hypothetical protein
MRILQLLREMAILLLEIGVPIAVIYFGIKFVLRCM